MFFLLQQQVIVGFQMVCGGKATHPASDDHYVVARRHWRLGEEVAIANLVANFIVFAVDDWRRGGGTFHGEQSHVHAGSPRRPIRRLQTSGSLCDWLLMRFLDARFTSKHITSASVAV